MKARQSLQSSLKKGVKFQRNGKNLGMEYLI